MSSAEQPEEQTGHPDRDGPVDDERVEDEQARVNYVPVTPRQARRAQRRAKSGGVLGFIKEAGIVIGTALIVSLLIKTFLFQAFYIPSESMERTLMVNDRIIVSLLEPGPFDLERGDVVVFRDPGGWLNSPPPEDVSGGRGVLRDVLTFVGILPQDSGEHLVKRVIGMPGDHVKCCDADGKLTINGVPITEDYLPPGTAPSTVDFDIVVPSDSVWVMGDNRDRSLDARFHQELPGGGSLKESYIVGRAVLLFWPWDRFGGLSNHSEVFAKVPDP